MTDTNKEAVELGLYDTDLVTKLAILPATDIGLYFELNQPGGGACKVHTLRSVASGLIQRGQFIRATYRGVVQGGFFVENIGKALASQGESADLWTPITGRGAMMLLEDAVVWSDGTEASTRDFSEQPKAAMLIALIEEAKVRGSLSTLIYDFTASLDSDGNAWTDAEPMQFSVGKTLLDVAREISDFGVDLNMVVNANGTFTLQAFDSEYGADKSTTIYFRRGVNCTDITEDERGSQIANALLIKHDGGYTVASDAVSIAAFRRREKLIDAIDAGNSANALTYGQALLEFSKEPKKEVSVQMFDGMAPYVFTDYICGDWIKMDTSGVEERLRVRSITLDWEDAEKAKVTVGLNTIVIENEIKMSNDIRKLFEMWRRSNDGQEVRLPFWAAIGKLSTLATTGTAIYAMAVSEAGKLYVGGDIDRIGQVDVGNAAVYDIATGEWNKLGTGFNGAVRAIACHGTIIYFGGEFTTADGVTVNRVCKYDEDAGTFSDMDTGVGHYVFALAVDSTNNIVYVGGYIYTAGALESAGVAAWHEATNTWSAMPGLLPYSEPPGLFHPDIYALAVYGTKVFAGGYAMDAPFWSLAVWDTVTEEWTPIGDVGYGPYATGDLFGGGLCYALAIIGDNLYIGGNFFSAFEVAGTENFVRYNITDGTFHSVDGGGIGDNYPLTVWCMTVVNGVDLYIGGDFLTAGAAALATNRIVKWDGGTYTLLGDGLNGACYALTSYNGNIGAGGVFTQAGGKPIKFVGAYITDLESILEYLETGGGASGYEHPNHTGDVVSVGDGAQTIQPNVVGNTKLEDMAEGTVKARISAGVGDPEDVTLEDFAAELGIPGAQTAKRVLISDASGVITTSEYLVYDETTKVLSLGETIVGFVQSVLINLSSNISRVLNLITWGSGNSSRFKGTFARGTIDAATAAQDTDTLSRFSGAGYDGTTVIQNAATSGELRFVAAENQAAGAHGTDAEIWLAPIGSATMVKVGTITNDGKINLEAGGEYLVNGVAIGGGGYAAEVEVDFGADNISEKTFTITDANVTADSFMVAQVKYAQPTSKDLDEVTMDNFDIIIDSNTGAFDMRLACKSGTVYGKFIVTYLVQ